MSMAVVNDDLRRANLAGRKRSTWGIALMTLYVCTLVSIFWGPNCDELFNCKTREQVPGLPLWPERLSFLETSSQRHCMETESSAWNLLKINSAPWWIIGVAEPSSPPHKSRFLHVRCRLRVFRILTYFRRSFAKVGMVHADAMGLKLYDTWDQIVGRFLSIRILFGYLQQKFKLGSPENRVSLKNENAKKTIPDVGKGEPSYLIEWPENTPNRSWRQAFAHLICGTSRSAFSKPLGTPHFPSVHLLYVTNSSPTYHDQVATMSTTSKVWLITGCSSGFGTELTKAALARGDKVIATARNISKIEKLKSAGAATLAVDITAGDTKVQSVVDEALKLYGTIDILVNNAANSLIGAVEECRYVRSTSCIMSAICSPSLNFKSVYTNIFIFISHFYNSFVTL